MARKFNNGIHLGTLKLEEASGKAKLTNATGTEIPLTPGANPEIHRASKINRESNSTLTYLEYLSTTTPSLEAGKTYLIGWAALVSATHRSRNIGLRIQVDGVDLHDPLDHATGTINPSARVPLSFEVEYTPGATGAAILDLDFRASVAAVTVYMHQAMITVKEKV